MSSAKYLLEHFYYGQPVRDVQPAGEPELLAASPGVTEALAAQCVERVLLPPVSSGRGAWALVRGRSREVPFILTQSQQDTNDVVMHHHIIATPDVLKAVGGNLHTLKMVVEAALPVYENGVHKLKPLALTADQPLSDADQIDSILELMMVTKNRFQTIEQLLASIVQGTQLIIQGAPADFDERVEFIIGLLALLPSSARFGVTFTTHSLSETRVDAQIRFYGDDPPPEDTVVFDWQAGKVSGVELKDDYSHYIISQLRLDAELVTRQNEAMASIAGWRLNQGDRLAAALGYAAKRLKLDEALRNNQPIDKDEAAVILRDDPTLNGELRTLYAGHLLRFSLVMEDMSHAEPIALLLRGNPVLVRSILAQMREALKEGQAWLLYDTLVSWMNNPLGPEGKAWVDLTHQALLLLLQEVVDEHDLDEVNEIMNDLLNAGPGLLVEQVTPTVIKHVLPLTPYDSEIAGKVFLLSIRHLETDMLSRLMTRKKFREQMPPEVVRTWAHLGGERGTDFPDGLLVNTARQFGEQIFPVLLRLAELAMQQGRIDMIDTPTLKAMFEHIQQPEYSHNAGRLLTVINTLDVDALLGLQGNGPRHLLQIRLAAGDYAELANQMINQSVVLYPGDLQEDYLREVERVFAETSLPPAAAAHALGAINENGIKALPFVVASAGALRGQRQSAEMDEAAARVVDYMLDEPTLLEITPPTAIMGVLNYYTRAGDADGMLRAARIVPLSASHQGNAGVRMLAETYKQMQGNPRGQAAALGMLRVYVRQAEDDVAQKVIRYFGKELGQAIQRDLEVTYTVRTLMGDRPLEGYFHVVQEAVEFISETMAVYIDDSRNPSQNTLDNILVALPGGLRGDDRRQFVREILALGELIVRLGRQYRNGRSGDDEKYQRALVIGDARPRSALDVLWVLSGGFTGRRRANITAPKADTKHILQGHSHHSLSEQIHNLNVLLSAITQALPVNKSVDLEADELFQEAESLSESEMDTQQVGLAMQRLVTYIAMLEENGDAKAFSDSGLARKLDAGRQRPRSTLEFYRYIAGYYTRA